MRDGIMITRRLPFCAGHRVLGHEGKCRHIHGHNYVAEVTVQAERDGLDALGRVVDFSVVKQLVGGWIDKFWDHNFIAHQDDPLVKHFVGVGHTVNINRVKVPAEDIIGRNPYIMPGGRNPTAEEMAKELYIAASACLPEGLVVRRVRMHETENCWADFIEPWADGDKLQSEIQDLRADMEKLDSKLASVSLQTDTFK